MQKGGEKGTKVIMLLLLILMIALTVNSVFLPNAGKGINFYLVPDFKSIQKEMCIRDSFYSACYSSCQISTLLS